MFESAVRRAIATLGEVPAADAGGGRSPWIRGEWRASEGSGLMLPPESHLIAPSDIDGLHSVFKMGAPSTTPFTTTPIALYATRARKAGDDRRADSFFRLAFARGEKTPEVVEAIEGMTARTLSSGLNVDIVEGADRPEGSLEYSLSDVASVRHFFEERVGSNITLMDVADVMDIFSPLFPLERISIHYDDREGAPRNEITVDGIYKGVEEDDLFFEVAINAEDGKAQIVFTSIDVGEFTRMGFGVRSLLSRSVFIRRHGLMGWRDKIWDEGLIVWPRLGAVVDDESARLASAMLECLDMLGVAKGFEDVNPEMDITELTGIKLNAEDVLDIGALYNWFGIYAEIPENELEFIHPPYRVGIMALESISVSGYFDAATTLHRMVREYLPGRIIRMGTRGSTERDRSATLLADIGLFTAYQGALLESDAIEITEGLMSRAQEPPLERAGGLVGITTSADIAVVGASIASIGAAGRRTQSHLPPYSNLLSRNSFCTGASLGVGGMAIASGLGFAAMVKIA